MTCTDKVLHVRSSQQNRVGVDCCANPCAGFPSHYGQHDGSAVLPHWLLAPHAVLVRCTCCCCTRRVQAAIAEAHQPGTGSVRQALCGALYEEVTDFYRLIATLEQQLNVPVPMPGGQTLHILFMTAAGLQHALSSLASCWTHMACIHISTSELDC
jgi:hypothetical protein